VGPEPLTVAVDPTARTAYVVNDGGDTVSVIDEATRSVTATIPWAANRSRWRWTPPPARPT